MGTTSSSSANDDSAKLDLPDLFLVDASSLNAPKSEPTPSGSVVDPGDTSSDSKVLSKKKRDERPTNCSVCGKPANWYHYDVPSCNGCKSFFRRVLISEKKFVCKGNKDCFDLKKREIPKKCRACRYLKCVSLGMNPLAIQVEEAEDQPESFKKLLKRSIKIEEGDDYVEIVEMKPGPSKTVALAKSITSVDEKMEKLIDILTYLELKVDSFRKCAYNPSPQSHPGLEMLLKEQNKISLADKLGPMQGWPLKQPVRPPPQRGPLPQIKAQDGPRTIQFDHDPITKMWFFYDLLTAVEYAKTFMFFHRLDMQDRVLLLKNVALACVNLHNSHFSIQEKFDRPIHPDGTMPYGKVSAKTIMSIHPLIRYSVSSREFILLKAICLCNPAVPGLSHYAQEIISHEREQYASVLLEHCVRDSKLGPSHFAHLIGIMDTLEHQQKIQKDIHTLAMLPITKNMPPMPLITDIMGN